ASGDPGRNGSERNGSGRKGRRESVLTGYANTGSANWDG
ncbi:MAG: hypothetical protein QOI50_1771, partial [Pseudonocardiales bacterium]|nr:hypothetical protein [Pseudonocardiales bacterium]